MMRQASNHQPLFARQPTFTQRIFASANDCLMSVTVNIAAEYGGQQSLHNCPPNALPLPVTGCTKPLPQWKAWSRRTVSVW